MTRRGSLAYYLAAWICGSFFMSAAIWLKDMNGAGLQGASLRGAFGLLFFSFYGLILGGFSALLGAFLLRRLAKLAHWERSAQWTFAGAFLAPIMIVVLGSIGRRAMRQQRPTPRWLSLTTYGPSVVLDAGWWLAIPAGAATAFILYRIHRAFAPEPRVADVGGTASSPDL